MHTNKDTITANKILINNIKLIDCLVGRINKGLLDEEEAKQIAYLTFLEEFPKYNSSKGALSTWIYGNLSYCIKRKYRQYRHRIKLPHHVLDVFDLINRGVLTGDSEQFIEMRKKYNNLNHISLKSFNIINNLYNVSEGLVKSYTEESKESLISLIDDTDYQAIDSDLTIPEKEAESRLTEQRLKCLLDRLNSREHYIVTNFYGLGENKHRTIREMATILNITPTRVGQIKDRAVHKIKKYIGRCNNNNN